MLRKINIGISHKANNRARELKDLLKDKKIDVNMNDIYTKMLEMGSMNIREIDLLSVPHQA